MNHKIKCPNCKHNIDVNQILVEEIKSKYELENSLISQKLNKTHIELEKEKRNKLNLELKLKADIEKEYAKRINEEREKLKIESENQHNLKLLEKINVIDQLKNQLSIAQKKPNRVLHK